MTRKPVSKHSSTRTGSRIRRVSRSSSTRRIKIDNSDIPTLSAPIIAARKRVGKNNADEGAAPVPSSPPDDWDILVELIVDYREAAITESWKGGGDPEEIPVAETMLQLATARLFAHIDRMRRRSKPTW